MYGGAAGGGKSDALLMAAAEFVHVPEYRALLLRRTYSDLSRPGALMNRAIEWWANKAKWHAQDKTFTFPSGATISFGYLQYDTDKYQYQGAELHFIGFDELTQFTESQYTYLFSRLRKTKNIKVPLRMRAGTNPGGIGHLWVKQRFIPQDAVRELADGTYRDVYEIKTGNDVRAFIPSMLADNPHIDSVEYGESLSKLDPLTRAQLQSGDWNASAEGRIKDPWLCWWTPNKTGEGYELLHHDKSRKGIIPFSTRCRRFHTVDCAGSSDDMAREKRGKTASYSVISTWDYDHQLNALIWRDMRRGRWEFPALCRQIREAWHEHGGDYVAIEDEKTGRAAIQSLRDIPTRPLSHGGKDKLTRAGRALNELEQHRVYLPLPIAGNKAHNDKTEWRGDLLDEMLTWTGHPDEQADQIDTLAYAAQLAFVWAGGGNTPPQAEKMTAQASHGVQVSRPDVRKAIPFSGRRG